MTVSIRKRFPITKPYMDECERGAILKPLETGWLVQGPYVAEFERQFATFVGTEYAIATTSCTTALHLGLIALEIEQGDKVVVPAFTYIASANAVEYTRAEVVFCDIDLSTFNIDMNSLEVILARDRQKDKRIKAIMPVNLFGLCADLPKIRELSEQYNLKIIEDSACGIGAYIGRQHSGTFGDVGCFSFHPRKSITTGEGGMLVTSDEQIANLVKSLRDHGASKSDIERHFQQGGSLLPEFNYLGYNYRMTDLQAAIGICQLEKLEYIISEKRKIANWYNYKIKELNFLLSPQTPKNYVHGFQSYVCLYTGGYEELLNANLKVEIVEKVNKERNRLMSKLEELGISTRQGTHAVHTLGYYRNKYKLKDEDYPKAYAADRLSITLPLFVGMSEEDVDFIIEAIKKCAG